MDISRLPAAPLSRPAHATYTSSAPVTPVDATGAARRSRAAPQGSESVERVVHGELLHRGRSAYQSTRGFLDERSFRRATPDGQPGTAPSRTAISHYLNHTRPETTAELVRGQSVNFFV